MRTRLGCIVVTCFMGVGSATAQAAPCQSQSELAALDQYCQAVPDGSGGRLAPPGGRPGPTVGSVVSRSTADALSTPAAGGVALLALPAIGPAPGQAPGNSERGTGKDGQAGRTGESAAREGDGRTGRGAAKETLSPAVVAAAAPGRRVDAVVLALLALASVVVLGGLGVARRARD